jgi:flavin-dependent dehydrogenase
MAGPALSEGYDVVVIGARVAGAATALLAAREGLRVLVLDRASPGSDTLSTHTLTRAGVGQLSRWGVLHSLIEAGTPPIQRTTFHYGDEPVVVVEIGARDGVDALFAPRRTVLDPILVEAARAAGAEIRHDCQVTALLRDDAGRVVGVSFTDAETGADQSVHAEITVGADGVRSIVARDAEAATYRSHAEAGAMLYGHFPDPGIDGYHWFYGRDAAAGIIPTNDERVCTWAGTSSVRFMEELRGNPAHAFTQLLGEAAPAFVDGFAAESAEGRIFGYPGQPSHMRQSGGPGWALVGDAGYFQDPLTAHGITDALRDAELLARAIAASIASGQAEPLAQYQATRDEWSMDFADVTAGIASYDWDSTAIEALVRKQGRLLATESRTLAAEFAPTN